MAFNLMSGSGELHSSGSHSADAFSLCLGTNLEDIFSEPPRDTSSPTQRTTAAKKGASRLHRDPTDGTMDSVGETVISSWSFLRAARGSNSCGITNNGDVTSPTTSDVDTSGYVDVTASNHFSNAMLPSSSEEEHSLLEQWNDEKLVEVPTPVLKSSPMKGASPISTPPVVLKPPHVNLSQNIRPHSLHPAVVPLPSQQTFMAPAPSQAQFTQQMQPRPIQLPQQQQQQQPMQQQQQGYTLMLFNPGNGNLMMPMPMNSQSSLVSFGAPQNQNNIQQGGSMQAIPQQTVNMYTAAATGAVQVQNQPQQQQQQEAQTYVQMTLPSGQVVTVPARAVFISNAGSQPQPQPQQMNAIHPSAMLQYSAQSIASQPVANFCTSTSPSQTFVNGQFGLEVPRPIVAAPAQRVKHIYNVHSALSDYLRFFSYAPTDASDAAASLPEELAVPIVPLFFQMLPTEHMRNAVQLLNRIIAVASALPDIRDDGKFVSERTSATPTANSDTTAPSLGAVVTTDNRNQSLTSLIALVRTPAAPRVIYKLRSRVLLDRHGFWYAENMEQYMKLKEYCESIRMLPHKERHLRTDGLPCMPLVVELSRSVKSPSVSQVVLPKVGGSAPAPIPFDCITPIHCSRPKE